MTSEAQREFERFLFDEARLMDANDYDGWFGLWAPDGLYWIPCNDDDVDPARGVSLVYETTDKLEDRILRLKSKFAHAQTPQSRLIRVVSNIVLEAADADGWVGTANFVLGEVRNDAQHMLFGRTRHILKRTADGFRIARKTVWLLNNDSTIGNLTFLV